MRKPKRSRRRTFLPLAERLEPRIALSGQVGVDLDSNSPYNDDPIWTDLHNLAFSWAPLTGTAAVPLTPDGYPLVNASVVFNANNYPNGTYGFSYAGGGTVSFFGDAELAAAPVVSNGVTTGTIVVDHSVNNGSSNTNALAMSVTNVNPSDPMDNLHIMMPGYGDGTTPEPMFTPAFLHALAPFSDIRFLNWDEAGGSKVSVWSQRVPPTALVTDSPAGVPYEDMIELCNESQKDMWINVPALATPAFVQDLAQLIEADLDPNLNVYVEYGNETWNNAGGVYGLVLPAAEANPLVTQNGNVNEMVAQQSAYEEVAIAKTFDQVFGAQSSRVRPIMAAQSAWSQIASWQLQFIQQNYGPPSRYIYASAVAPYVGFPSSSDNVAGLTINQLFADLNQYMNTYNIPWIESDAVVAKQYGVGLVAYEGGQGIRPGANDLNLGLMESAQEDPRMYQLYLALMNDWQQVGGGVFDAYQLDGYPSQYGLWGMLPNVQAAGSQKFDALLSLILPAGDADLDGVVDEADFQAVEADYGETGQYWEQGDFNDDGSVNWQDLNILRQDLDPAGFTLDQFAQQALFGDLSTVDTPTALEYDGYGVTYASSLPFAASSGTVKPNTNSRGQAIVLGGAGYSEGLGVLANSSVSLALGGQYARYESTIGVDGTSNTGSSVIFEVYGDGKLLYQSPTMNYASGAVPIDVNVAGVTTLTLAVLPATGSTASSDNAVWADARLVSTANFGATQPYTLTWQLSQGGTVLSTQTTDSFVFAALSGAYTITLTVTNAQRATATASTNVEVLAPIASASHFAYNTTLEGDWIGKYGTQGYDIAQGPVSLPAYATVATSAATYTWTASTTAPQALDAPSGSFGIATCWYSSTSFTVDVDLTDGQAHDLALYFVDYDKDGRVEQVRVSNAATGAVMETETVSSFTKGLYLQWALSGNILITITRESGANAVLSGLFFDPPTPTPAATIDRTTQGAWIGTYGAQGYDIPDGGAYLPNDATVATSGSIWSTTTTVPQALEEPNGIGRIATCWYSSTRVTVDVDLTDGQAHDLALYFLDFGNNGRVEQVQISNAGTGAVLSTQTISSFATGVYLQWTLSGNILITITRESGVDAVLSGLFFDPAPPATAAFVTHNVGTGSWVGAYGTQGYDIAAGPVSLPGYATVTTSGATPNIWSTTTTVLQALEEPSGTGRIASCWYSSTSFTVDLDLTDGQAHDLSLYFVDYDNQGRVEQVRISNAATGAVLDMEMVSSFSEGVYLQWAVSGNILIAVTRESGVNAVLSGLFLDPIGRAAFASSATLIDTDTTTEGSWIGPYGAQGYDIADGAVGLPGYATVATSGATPYLWSTTTTDPRALEDVGGTGSLASCWYSSTSFAVDVDLTDGLTHDLSLYFLDWDSTSRAETVQISDALTGAVLSIQQVTSFHTGTYLTWAISGNVAITIKKVSGVNAVVGGLFLE